MVGQEVGKWCTGICVWIHADLTPKDLIWDHKPREAVGSDRLSVVGNLALGSCVLGLLQTWTLNSPKLWKTPLPKKKVRS